MFGKLILNLFHENPPFTEQSGVTKKGKATEKAFLPILGQGVLSNFTNFIQTHFTTFETKNIQIIEKIPYRFSQKRLGRTFR